MESLPPKKIYSSVGRVQGRFHEEFLVCQFPARTNSEGGIWFGNNIFDYSFPVLLAQLTLILLVTRTIFYLFKPLKQSMISAQLIAGILMGQSFFGRIQGYSTRIFPPGGRIILETFADVGFMLHLFILGVRIDASMAKRVQSKIAIIGISGFLLPYALGGVVLVMLPRVAHIDESLKASIPALMAVNSISAFPVITHLLQDLKILNSEVGRIATWASMSSDICTYSLSILIGAVGLVVKTSKLGSLWSLVNICLFLLFVVFVVRPLVVRLGSRLPAGKALPESYFLAIMVIVLLCGLCTEALGQPAALGTFIVGIAMPDGPPIGSTLVNRIEILATGILLPAKFAITGLSMNMLSIKGGINDIIIESIIAMGYIGKFLGVLIPALAFRIPFLEAITLAFVMCCKGVIEASIYIMLKDNMILSDEAYALLLITMLVTTGIARPLIWYIYDPSSKYLGYRTNSIMFSDPHDEIRVLTCINREDNVPSLISLLELSNPSRDRLIGLLALNLMELQGSAAAMVVSGSPKKSKKLNKVRSRSDRISSAFDNFAQLKEGSVYLEHFTAIAPYASMHNDICSIALDRRVNIVITPFHKQWAIDGTIDAVFPAIRMVNQNILQKAPCSVGIFIDRGNIAHNQSMVTGKSMFRVVMLFIGGSDDCEALAYCSRMAGHPYINFTLIWIRSNGGINHGNETIESDMIERFRADNEENSNFEYQEENVADAVGTTLVLRSLQDRCDFCVVGRYHDPQSDVIFGLTEWSECPELGLVGDMLASSDFQFSVLVVQHQPQGGESFDAHFAQNAPARLKSGNNIPFDDINELKSTV